jgi:aminoglycoside phosphotransferase (APT) family kinase protein
VLFNRFKTNREVIDHVDKTALLLNSLKTILANPALRRCDDTALGEVMEQADIVLACLLARQTEVPGLLDEVRASYTRLIPSLQNVCDGNLADSAAVSKLQQALASSASPNLESILPPAVEVLNTLHAIASPEALNLCKQMFAIESRYSNKYNAALRAAKAPDATGDASGAAHVKAYDEDALCRFIVSQYPNEQGIHIANSSFLSGGHSKYTMGIELSGNHALPSSLVLRADAGSGFGGSSVVEEYRLLKILYEHGAQVPKPIGVEKSGAVFGSPFLLVEKRPGRSIGHMFMLPPPNRFTARDIATQLAKIHSIPADAFGSITAGADTTTKEHALAWIDQSCASWKALNTPGALLETSFRWLRANVDRYEGRRALVHGDYGLNNMLIDNGQMSAVLDWEFAHIGNPAYDLGYFRFQAEALGAWDEFLCAYAAAGGAVPDAMQLDYANLLAETRLTVMTRQAEAAYNAGVPQGIAGAINAASGYRNTSDERIATLLNRVM